MNPYYVPRKAGPRSRARRARARAVNRGGTPLCVVNTSPLKLINEYCTMYEAFDVFISYTGSCSQCVRREAALWAFM